VVVDFGTHFVDFVEIVNIADFEEIEKIGKDFAKLLTLTIICQQLARPVVPD
jgi:hypothetical protein